MARAPATDGGDAASAFRARDDGARRAYNVEIPAAWQRESVDESLLRGHRSALRWCLLDGVQDVYVQAERGNIKRRLLGVRG